VGKKEGEMRTQFYVVGCRRPKILFSANWQTTALSDRTVFKRGYWWKKLPKKTSMPIRGTATKGH